MSGERSLKDAILGFANGFAGVCEWLEDVEKGVEPIAAAKKAYKNVRRRKVAVKKATRELSETVGGGESNVIDVTPRIRREKA